MEPYGAKKVGPPPFELTIPDDEDLLPEVRALGPVARKMLYAKFCLGDVKTNTDAAWATGHFSTRESAQVYACRTAAKQNYKEALRAFATQGMEGEGLVKAYRGMMYLAENSAHKDHYKALEYLLGRNGMQVATVTRHEHVHELTLPELQKQLKELGVDPNRLALPKQAEQKTLAPVDAEFEEVEPAMSSEGLEDLL